MKLLSNKTLMLVLILVSTYGYIVSCTRDNDTIVPVQLSQPFVASRGTNVHLPGNMTVGNNTEWKLDKVHSNVLWSTKYMGAAGYLTGRFNSFGMHDVTTAKMLMYPYTDLWNPAQPLKDSSWAFYENDPSKIYFNGYVQINTSNTGEPKRDGSLFDPTIGCNLGTLGTTAQIQLQHNLTVTNLAKIKTKKVEFDQASNGYIVTLDLTWQGKMTAPVTKELIGKLNYVRRSTPTGATYDVFGLQLLFSFNCRDFGITSGSVADQINIECNMNFNNK